ncbi:diacylglycerol kinase theta-like [Vitis riparia]|uniref:diacylglycerol kinase theta-like n=1 Tax=Vitis riparia TaxID=96939 RepID=UPI00155A3A2A|nr:diacylglycerol kinase theta-like [Vitis riparia]
MKPNIKEHFTNPGHSLTKVYGSEEFHCDGCKTPGNGPRYRCHTCDSTLHEYCGVCPSTLSTFMHPQHQLKQVIRTQGRRVNERLCTLCRDDVEGLFYQCTDCDFDIHPLCTKIPESVPHPLHPTHQLKLQTSSSGRCSVCKGECTSWRYGCAICTFDIHLECILAQCETPTISRSLGAPITPAPPPYGPYGIAPPLHPWGVYGGLPPYSAYGPWYPYYSSTPHLYNWPSSTPFSAYAHACAYAPPPPSSFLVPPPSSGFYAHGGTTDFGPHNTNNQAQGTGKQLKGMLSKIIYSLSMGVLTNLIAGGITGGPS